MAVVLVCLTTACGAAAPTGDSTHPGFDLPTESGTVGTYLRDCLSPGTGLTTGSDAPTSVGAADVAAIIRCDPDPGRNAVIVSQATGDPGPLLGALASRERASTGAATKQTVFVVFLRDSSTVTLTASGVPESAIDTATFRYLGTTPPGSL